MICSEYHSNNLLLLYFIIAIRVFFLLFSTNYGSVYGFDPKYDKKKISIWWFFMLIK